MHLRWRKAWSYGDDINRGSACIVCCEVNAPLHNKLMIYFRPTEIRRAFNE